MLRINRFVLLAALIATISGLHSCAEEASREDLHFIVAGHVCGGPTDTLGGIYQPFERYYLEKFNDTTIDFSVFTGDLVHKSDLRSWSLVDVLLKKSGKPFYIAPGNQDLRDRALFEKRYGKTNHHFERGNSLFLFWDVLPNGWNVSDKQLNELLKLTAEKHYDNVFIFTHQVIWQDNRLTPQIIPNDIDGRAAASTFYPATIQALSQNETPVYLFAGDVGALPLGSELTIHKYKNVRLIASGMGGGKWDNVIEVMVKDGKASITVNYLNGSKPFTLTDQYVPITF